MEGDIVQATKILWPERLATYSWRCIKWGLILLIVGIFVGFVLMFTAAALDKSGSLPILSNFIVISFFIVCISSILICNVLFFGGLILSLIALLGILSRNTKIHGAVCASCVLTFTIFVFAAELVILYKLHIEHQKMLCLLNMRELNVCYWVYKEEKELFAHKENWNDIISPYVHEKRWFQCPCDKIGPCSYAMNENIPADATQLPDDLVVLFESAPGWNQVGGPDEVVSDRHHKYGAVILFADGFFKFVPAEDIPNLRWTVDKNPERE